MSFAAQYPAYTSPCQRFAPEVARSHAWLGAVVGRYTFNVENFHL